MDIDFLKKRLSESKVRLQKAVEGKDLPEFPATKVQEVIEKFFEACQIKADPALSRREIEVLASHLDTQPTFSSDYEHIIGSPHRLRALSLILDSWNERFLKPLFQLYMRLWRPNIKHEATDDLRLVIQMALDKNAPALTFGKTLKLYEEELLMSSSDKLHKSIAGLLFRELIDYKAAFDEAIMRLPLPESYWSTQLSEYASIELFEKIIGIYTDTTVSILTKRILNKHNIQDLNYLVLSKIINTYEEKHQSLTKATIITLALETLKLSVETPWRLKLPQNYPPHSQSEIDKAYKTLIRWLYGKLIYSFFDKIAVDKDRALFWEDQPHITDITIFVPDGIKEQLLHDGIVPQSIIRRKVRRNSRLSSIELSAILMETKDYLLVDFSTTGHAFYAYLKSSTYCPHLLREPTLQDLKNPIVQNINAIEVGKAYYSNANYDPNSNTYYITKPEGRAFHQGLWQPKFRYWLSKYIS